MSDEAVNQNPEMVEILLINNEGNGFAGKVTVPIGTTAGQLFKQQLGEMSKPSDYLIRINRNPTTEDYVLQAGDRATITSRKIQGARLK